MTTGVRIIGGSSSDVLVNYDEAIGWGRIGEYPSMGGTGNEPGSISGSSMRDFWVQSYYYYQQIAYHWNGYVWQSYVCYGSEGGYHGGIHAPHPDACHVCWKQSNSNWAYIHRWTGSGFTQPVSRRWWGAGPLPWTYSPTGVFVVSGGPQLGVGSHLYQLDGTSWTRDSGLADQALYGLVMLGSYPYDPGDDLFILAADGYVYRGPFGGPFVVDNPTAGPFSPQNYNRSQICTDGTYIWVHDRGNDLVWKRLDVDTWIALPGGVSASNGELDAAIANDGTDRVYISGGIGRVFNGTSWETINFDNNVRGGAWAFRGDSSSGERTFYSLARDRNRPFLDWKGDAEQSPWAPHPHSPDSLVGVDADCYALEAFLSGELMIAVNISGAGGLETWHFDPVGESWSRHLIVDGANYVIARLKASHGRIAINADQVHACGWGPGGLYYFKWNGTGWTAVAITGSDSTGVQHHMMELQVSDDGQEIWISHANIASPDCQLWHSTDGGNSWTNRAAAAIVASGAGGTNYIRDVEMVSSTEAYVAIWESDVLSRYAKWNGTDWDLVPSLPSKVGTKVLHWDGTELWAVTAQWSGSGDARAYKLVAGAWVEDYDISLDMYPRAIASMDIDGDRVIVLGSYQLNERRLVRDPRNSADGKEWLNWRSRAGVSAARTDMVAINLIDDDPPYLTNQDPPPGSTNNPADTHVYLEVVDDNGNLAPATVEIYINNTLAWRNGLVMIGFTGGGDLVAGGMGYVFRPTDPFEPGLQTVRAVGSDTKGNVMDESYTFSTRPLLIDAEDVAAALPNAGVDLLLNSHDIKVEERDLVLVAGVDEVAQHLLVYLKLFLGEWFLDELAGMPYYRDVFVANPNTRVIETVFRQAIISDEDIEHLREFEMSVNRATRKLNVTFVAVSSVGEVSVSAVFP